MPNASRQSLPNFADIGARVAAYRAGRDPFADLDAVFDAIAEMGERPIWISLLSRDQARALLTDAQSRLKAGADLPLYGIPFAVKDNIDVAGLPTTAGCSTFSYNPERSAFVIERLIAAGAIPVGKTNLDQFATGLNGSRSPYGIPSCAFDEAYVSGGSSSGSALAVAHGLVPLALGTDTAGSGRILAGFNNIVGLKPTRGLMSNTGLVPACRTLDCISIFAGSSADALTVLRVASGYDAEDAYSRDNPAACHVPSSPRPLRFGKLQPDTLARCADDVAARYLAAVEQLEADGGQAIEIDYAPLEEAASLLYAGPWVAERLAAIKDFAASNPDDIHPAVREIVLEGANYSAVDTFEAQYRLADLTRQASVLWKQIDVLLLPTSPEHPTIAAMLDAPIALNARLGLFTNFVNLMDLAGISVPFGCGDTGLPIGVTLIGPAFSDGMLAAIGDRLHRTDTEAKLGATPIALAGARPVATTVETSRVKLAVVGAHLKGQPLNHQLTSRGATFIETAHTATGYSLYALPGTTPPKPGLVRGKGRGLIEVEIWELTAEAFGSFVSEIPPPLGIGSLELADGSVVKGFICETYAIAGATDITDFGAWRKYLNSKPQAA